MTFVSPHLLGSSLATPFDSPRAVVPAGVQWICVVTRTELNGITLLPRFLNAELGVKIPCWVVSKDCECFRLHANLYSLYTGYPYISCSRRFLPKFF